MKAKEQGYIAKLLPVLNQVQQTNFRRKHNQKNFGDSR